MQRLYRGNPEAGILASNFCGDPPRGRQIAPTNRFNMPGCRRNTLQPSGGLAVYAGGSPVSAGEAPATPGERPVHAGEGSAAAGEGIIIPRESFLSGKICAFVRVWGNVWVDLPRENERYSPINN